MDDKRQKLLDVIKSRAALKNNHHLEKSLELPKHSSSPKISMLKSRLQRQTDYSTKDSNEYVHNPSRPNVFMGRSMTNFRSSFDKPLS